MTGWDWKWMEKTVVLYALVLTLLWSVTGLKQLRQRAQMIYMSVLQPLTLVMDYDIGQKLAFCGFSLGGKSLTEMSPH